jgi:hypothetical protein
MSRRRPAKARNLLDVAKLLFVLALLLAFGMRRGLAEARDRLPWLGAALFGFIALTGGFLLISALLHRKSAIDTEETESESAPEPPVEEAPLLREQDTDRPGDGL